MFIHLFSAAFSMRIHWNRIPQVLQLAAGQFGEASLFHIHFIREWNSFFICHCVPAGRPQLPAPSSQLGPEAGKRR